MNEKNLTKPSRASSSSKVIWIIVFSAFITTLVVGGTVYFWHRSVIQSFEQSSETEISNLRNWVKELRADWKTYNNGKLGFSIDYPGSWEIKESNGNRVDIFYPEWRQVPEGGGSVVISVEDKTLEQFINDYNSSDIASDGTALSKIFSRENYTLNGISGYKLVGTTAIGLDQSFIFISHNNKSYIVSFNDYDDAHLAIIRTFKFN
jgi:hypothetical protein